VLGSGSTFTLSIPTQLQYSKKTQKSGSSKQVYSKHLNILVVDDSDDNLFLVEAFLKKMPYTLTFASDGLQALAAFKEGYFDLILMDIQMPNMDGKTATIEIRKVEKEFGLKRTPVIALTAETLNFQVEEAIKAGCDIHLTKPISKAQLLEQIYRTVNESQEKAA